MFHMDREAKVSTVTPSSDLPLRVKGQKRSKLKIVSNGKTNSVSVFHTYSETKVSTVTPSSDLPLKVKGQKRSNFQIA